MGTTCGTFKKGTSLAANFIFHCGLQSICKPLVRVSLGHRLQIWFGIVGDGWEKIGEVQELSFPVVWAKQVQSTLLNLGSVDFNLPSVQHFHLAYRQMMTTKPNVEQPEGYILWICQWEWTLSFELTTLLTHPNIITLIIQPSPTRNTLSHVLILVCVASIDNCHTMQVFRVLERQSIPADTFVVNKGELGDCMFFVLNGEMEKVYPNKEHPNKKEVSSTLYGLQHQPQPNLDPTIVQGVWLSFTFNPNLLR